MRIAVIMACHNRCAQTLACLHSLKMQSAISSANYQQGYTLSLWLLDDASMDGTAEGVCKIWPNATILRGDGNLYWCGGMRVAWAAAEKSDPDYYLLLNDDTVVESTALADLLKIVGSPKSRIIATGAITDPTTQKQIYGGHRKRGRRLVAVTGQPERCETMNANCALVPRAVFREMGVFHPAYTHSMGDFDYGFEANRRGIFVYQTGKIVGLCRGNSESGSWRDRSLSRRCRLALLQSPKGLPWRDWLTYTRRNEGFFWPLKFASPIIRILINA